MKSVDREREPSDCQPDNGTSSPPAHGRAGSSDKVDMGLGVEEMAIRAGDGQRTYVILFCNLGVGKSTLPNSLTASTPFRSRVSVRDGITTTTQRETEGGISVSDTPGLTDLYMAMT